MEVSGVVPIKALAFHGGSGGTFKSIKTQKAKNVDWVSVRGGRRLCAGRCSLRAVDDGFGDKGHLEYYGEEKKGLRKKLKALKKLAEGYDMLGEIGNCDDVEGSSIKEEKELLFKQWVRLKMNKKAMKKRKKEEKKKCKANRMKTKMSCDSSSESSSSSDSECGDVINSRSLRSKVLEYPIEYEIRPVNQDSLQSTVEGVLPMLEKLLVTPQETASPAAPSFPIQEESITKERGSKDCASGVVTDSSSIVRQTGKMLKKIEVCMGGKCKKSGAGLLLDEFGRAMGGEGVVVGCKCMGKCKNGPNVRVYNIGGGIQLAARDDSVRSLANPLYMGVRLGDVSEIMSSLY